MNAQMLSIFQEDQADRANQGLHPEYLARDRERRRRVKALAESGALDCADAYMMAALIFQHGEAPDDFWQAHLLARKAWARGLADAAWLAAAALDRFLNRQGKPVKFGTQYLRMAGIYRTPRVDPATSDAERITWGLPPLAVLLAQSHAPGTPPTTVLGSLSVPGLTVTVRSLPRELTWHCEMLPGRMPTGLFTLAGTPVWANTHGWHWAETGTGELQVGWFEMPYAPELGHTVALAQSAEVTADAVAGRPAIWVDTGDGLQTLYVRRLSGGSVLAVTGRNRDEVMGQTERLEGFPASRAN
jgi:hypothetical protein